MVPGKITPYGYGISSEKVEREKGVRPNVGKETSYIFPSIFVHRGRGSKLIENSGKRAGDMQC